MFSELMILMRLFGQIISTALLSSAICITANAEQANIAVASNFNHTMKILIQEFEKTSSHQIKASYGSSGKIYAQIHHGAPFQVFFSADQLKPLALYNEGFTIDKPFTYALGALALWSSNRDFKHQELEKLQSGEFNKLALANPKLAPYGIAAMDTLAALSLIEETRKKWIQGENIAQTYQFVGTGNADLGFVALSQVIHKHNASKADFWKVPAHLYSPIRQDAVVLKSAKNNAAVWDFLDFINSHQGRMITQSFGYETQEKLSQEPNPLP